MMAPAGKKPTPAARHIAPAGCAVCGKPASSRFGRSLDEAPYALCSAECARLFDEAPRSYAYEPRPERP
jgi:hypothetical protein